MIDIIPAKELIEALNHECTCQPPYDTMPGRTDPRCDYHDIGAELIDAAREWLRELGVTP